MACFFCGGNAESREYENRISFTECEYCGRYAFSLYDIPKLRKDWIASYLYHNNKLIEKERPEAYATFIGKVDSFSHIRQNNPDIHLVTEEEIKAYYPRRFAERIDKILFALAKRSRFFGDQVFFHENELKSMMFLTYVDDFGQIIDPTDVTEQVAEVCIYLENRSFTRIESEGVNQYITLLSEGWSRIDELQRQNVDNRDVFVSMSFTDKTKSTREAIREGILDAGFSPEFIDEIIHNRQIVPEMFRLIRECRLLILDISDPNYGAYYEAGYALGLGKEVIICCSRDRFIHKYESEDEKKFERYLKPHFDIAQKQLLIWDNYEDLSKKICEWIKSLIR